MPDSNTDHMWVELKYLPVTIEINPDDQSMEVYGSEEADVLAEEGKTWFCWFCHTPANSDTVGTECPGEKVA